VVAGSSGSNHDFYLFGGWAKITKYLNAVGMKVDLKDVEGRLREQSLLSIGIATGIGFILGGGLGTRPGVMLLGLFGRRAARQMATNAGRELPQNARLRNDRAR
jgi:hypothetical protein